MKIGDVDATVLVTGASGFIGAHVVRALVSKGRRTVALVREAASDRRLAGLGDRLTIARGDVTKSDTLAAAFSTHRPAIVINAAAHGVDPGRREPLTLFQVNVGGVVNLFEAGARFGLRRFIQLGSCFEYAAADRALREDDAVAPQSPYAASKTAASFAAGAMARALNVEASVLRLFGVWGPGEGAQRLAPQILQAWKKREPLALTSGQQVRDLSYVDDMAERIVALSVHPELGRHPVVNVASGQAITVRDFAESLARALGSPVSLEFGRLPARSDEAPLLVADVSLQTRLVGAGTLTSREEGVRRMLAAFQPDAV